MGLLDNLKRNVKQGVVSTGRGFSKEVSKEGRFGKFARKEIKNEVKAFGKERQDRKKIDRAVRLAAYRKWRTLEEADKIFKKASYGGSFGETGAGFSIKQITRKYPRKFIRGE